jgi:hypothetical protein
MYCPKCGESNSEETKFCRTCGENLKVVAQAMMGRLPVILASKLDAYIERRNERLRRDGIGSAVFGVCFVLLGVSELTKGTGIFGTAGILLLFAFFMFLVSIWDMMAYERSLNPKSRMSDSLSILPDNEIAPHHPSRLESPPSVTESTTRTLLADAKRQKERP